MKVGLTVLDTSEEVILEVLVSVRGFATFSICSVVPSFLPGMKMMVFVVWLVLVIWMVLVVWVVLVFCVVLLFWVVFVIWVLLVVIQSI